MSFDVIYSDWLSSSFENIVASKEWNVFISDLHTAVDHQLTENNIDNFHNLLDHEKAIMIHKALLSLHGSLCYQIIQERISQVLDVKINNEAERIIRIDINPFQTRTEAILSSAYEGIISILGRWPDLKYKLTKMFNQNTPSHLRHHIWKAVLDNPEVLHKYQKAMKSKTNNSISQYDQEISKNCENLLNNEPLFFEMKGSVGCFYGLKAILSYFQASVLGDIKLRRNDYLFAIPIVYVLCNKLSFREPPTIKVMEVLVQEYFSLRHMISVDMPYIELSSKTSQDQYRYFCQQVYRCMTAIDMGTAQMMMDHLIPSQDSIVATEIKLFDLAGEVIEKLLRPVVTGLFVGFLSMATLLFVWDQFLLGFDNPGFREKFWPMITGIFLELIVRRRIINRNQSIYVPLNEDLLRNEGPKLKPFDFQYQINKSFYVEFMRIINLPSISGMDPITEPLKWKHWFDSIHHISPISPQDRNEMRALRQEERDKLFNLQTKLESVEQEKLKLEDNLEIQCNVYMANYEKAANKYKTDKDLLKQELENMHQKALESDQVIRDLQHELERIRIMKRRHSSVINYRGLVPPPSSPKSHVTSRKTSLGKYENYSVDPLNQFAEDFVVQMSNSFQTILNGDGKEKFDLNDETINFLKLFEEDRQETEMSLFGRHLNPGELQLMDSENDGYYSKKINQEIAKKTNERRKLRNFPNKKI